MTYCEAVLEMKNGDPNIYYHDEEYGFPIADDNELFGRLTLEINQAGLSWTTILRKADNFRKAYSGFDISEVANYSEKESQRLLNDAGIIRNKLKVNAAITNARIIIDLQKEYGSFKNWLDTNHPLEKDEWVRLFKKTGFRFVGGEIINEFLMSTGYLKGAHDESCPVYDRIMDLKPAWAVV
jgi:DNA-3-methyladenine glycosylase I